MTEKLFYKNAYLSSFEATVTRCEKHGDKWLVVLNKTCFYPEGGGQPADHGRLGDAVVSDVHEKDGEIIHTVDREFNAGDRIAGEIDWDRRFDHMQQHSGEHIVSGMLCSSFNCSNVGFHMGSEIIQIDYNADIPWDDILKIEERANRYIWENHILNIMWPTPDELARLDYRSKKELTGPVRITEWPGADRCACCGTHVSSSSEVGLVKLLSVEKIKDGVRIEMLSGKRAFDYLSRTWAQNQDISRELSAKPYETAKAVSKLKEEGFKQRSRIAQLEDSVFETLAEKYLAAEAPVVFADDLTPDGVRKLCDMISEKAAGRCIVLSGSDGAYKYAVIHKDHDIRDFIREMNSSLNGRGGGKNGFAQGNLTASRDEIERFLLKSTKMKDV